PRPQLPLRSRALECDAASLTLLDDNARYQRIRNHREIAAAAHWIDERGHHGLAPSIANGRLPWAEPFRVRRIEVRAAFVAQRRGGFQEAADQWIRARNVEHVHRAASPVIARC